MSRTVEGGSSKAGRTCAAEAFAKVAHSTQVVLSAWEVDRSRMKRNAKADLDCPFMIRLIA